MASKNKKKSNSRSARKEKGNSNKVVSKKENKFALSDSDIENIKIKTNQFISELEKRSKNPFLFTKKNLIKSQIADLKICLENEEYYLLDSKIKAFDEMVKKEKKEFEEENQKVTKNTEKEPKPKKSLKETIKTFDSWPLYSRIKRILNNYDGKERTQRLILVGCVFSLLLIVALIGLLLVLNVIPYDIGGDQQRIGPLVCLVIPLVCLIFV
ncbi:MAG: hypothetical protein K2O21_01110 [Malacoplasma sp.]|nr:hypothetical protein [Malacoplasma sp.]